MKRLATIFASLIVTVGCGALVLAPASVQAASSDATKQTVCVAEGGTWVDGVCKDKEGQEPKTVDDIIQTVINIAFLVLGILCVVFIILGGISYTVSRGKDEQVKKAKATILYAVIGLIVALVAYALVNWVYKMLSS